MPNITKVSRPSATTLPFRHADNDNDVRVSKPTPIRDLISAELAKIAHALGSSKHGWVAAYRDDRWHIEAYAARHTWVIARADDVNLRVALARLLGEIYAGEQP